MAPHRSNLAVGLALVVLLVGCLGASGVGGPTPTEHAESDAPRSSAGSETPAGSHALQYEAYVFDHAGIESPVVDGGIAYPTDGEYARANYATIVTSREDADRLRLRRVDEGAAAFVANTSFDRSYLIAIQEFPASSNPNYRVERVESGGGTVHLSIDDSSRGATADVTVETLLVRVRGNAPERAVVTTEDGCSFSTDDGVVERTPRPTPASETAKPPYRSSNDSENVAEPRDVRIENAGNRTNGYRIAVTYDEVPACRRETPPCGAPTEVVTVLETRGKLPAGSSRTIEDVAAREGKYRVVVEAMVPGESGSRRSETAEFAWRISEGRGDAVVEITDEGVSVRQAPEAAATL